MSEFEFIVVLMSFIVAFGASELLSGWGRQYLTRASSKPYPLQLAVSALVFLALIQSLWGYWGFRSVSWDFGSFILALTPLLPIVGAAGIILPPAGDMADQKSPRQHYESVYRAIFVLLAMWVAFGTLTEVILVDSSLHLGQAARLLGVLILISLSFTSKPAIHWVGLGILAALQLVFVGVVTPTLG